MNYITRKRAAYIAALLALGAPCGNIASGQSQALAGPSATRETGRIRGVAFDSLHNKAIARVSIALLSTSETTVTDDKGRFEFAAVPTGKQYVVLTSAEFDSLGRGTIGTAVDVITGETAQAHVATPSIHTLWSYRCSAANTFGNDSGVVWGTIRDAKTHTALNSASAVFSWYDLKPGNLPGLLINEIRKEAITDASGVYFACGLPTDLSLASTAVTSDAASGRVDFTIGASRLHRMDLQVSADMVVPPALVLRTHEDSVNAEKVRGTSTLRGVVTDEKRRPLANAIVALAETDSTVRTNSEGKFQIASLPAGTHGVFVRRVGASPVVQLVNLHPDSATDITVQMSNVTTLATVNVRSEKVMGKDRVDFEQRRKIGWAHIVEGDALTGRADMYSALSGIVGLRIERDGFGISAKMRSIGMGGSSCSPTAFLDGVRTQFDWATSMPPNQYRAVEVYEFSATVPAEYTVADNYNYGVVLFWSKGARW